MRRFINLKMTGEKENCDEILKYDGILRKNTTVESDQELRKALLISVFLSLSIILQIKFYIYSSIFTRNKTGSGKYSNSDSPLCIWNKRSR